MLKSKLPLLIMILTVLALLLTACTQPIPPPKPEGDGTIVIYVTDAPVDDEVACLLVTLSGVQVHRASSEEESAGMIDQIQAQGQEQDEEGEWVTVNLTGNTTIDLVQIKGIEQFLGTSEVEAATYTKVRLVVDKIQVQVCSGNLTDCLLPEKELEVAQLFNVLAGETTALILDFEADEMVALPKASEVTTLTGADRITVKPIVNVIVRQEKP
jgi:hypothetical protein